MPRPLLLLHGYSSSGLDFKPLYRALIATGIDATLLNVGNYVSLNNEVTIADIAEGLQRAIEMTPGLADEQEFDVIVHSTGMLVARAWLAHQRAVPGSNPRLARLKHLIGVAPATWGSPQAAKGRTWLGALVKGNKTPGPDFMNAGNQVLDGLELGSKFTWDLAHIDLLGATPYFGTGADTPYVAVFIGNQPYDGLSSVANDPGTDGTVRWSGCGLNTRKITLDLTRTPTRPDGTRSQPDGTAVPRVQISEWASDSRLDVPILAVDGRNHGTLISNPDPGMVDRIASFLNIASLQQYTTWLSEAQTWAEPAQQAMLVDPGKDAAGIGGDFKKFFGNLFHLSGAPLEGWQQFVVHARDEHGDPVTDYMVEVYRQDATGAWVLCEEMSTDVHAYGADPSYRCLHVRLEAGISNTSQPMQIHVSASTGTDLVTYQGYGSEGGGQEMRADTDAVVLDITGGLGAGAGSLFYPFTTTLVEIVLNRVPFPFGQISGIFNWVANMGIDPPAAAQAAAQPGG